MTIREKVALAICENDNRGQTCPDCNGTIQHFKGFLRDGTAHERDRPCPYSTDATAAINAFLEAAAEDGWHMLLRDEVTEEMKKAGMEAAPLNYYEDRVSSRRRISMDTDEVGSVYIAMVSTAPEFEWEK